MADWEDVADGDGGSFENGFPPGFERSINCNVEGGFGWGSFSKGVGSVGAVGLVVVESVYRPKSACSSLIECSGVGVCKGDRAAS